MVGDELGRIRVQEIEPEAMKSIASPARISIPTHTARAISASAQPYYPQT